MLIRGKVLTGHDHQDVSGLSEQFRQDIQGNRRKNALAKSSAPEIHRKEGPVRGARRLERKGTNRYKFQSISKLMSSTQIDLRNRPFQSNSIRLLSDSGARRRKQSHAELNDEALASYFAQAMDYWRELDRSAGFREFYREVVDRSKNLLLVIHNKSFLAERLLARLSAPDVISYKTYLDLLCLLALDLQDEFYFPHFGQSLGALARLIDTTPPQLAEQIFSTIIFLFKFSLKNLLKESHQTFQEFYVPLLAHHRDFVRRFSADTFAYLCRRVAHSEQLSGLLQFMTSREHLERLLSRHKEEQPSARSRRHRGQQQDVTTVAERFRDGLSHVLACIVKGVKYRFHSSLPQVLGVLLDSVCRAKDTVAEHRHRLLVLQGVLRRLCNYTRPGPEKADVVFQPLLARTLVWSKDAAAQQQQQSELILQGLLSCVRLWTEFRGGSRVTDAAPLLQLLNSLLLEPGSPAARSPAVLQETLELLLISWPLLARFGCREEALALLRGASGLLNPHNWISVFNMVGRLVRLQEHLESRRGALILEQEEDEEDDSDAEDEGADVAGKSSASAAAAAAQDKAAANQQRKVGKETTSTPASSAMQRMIEQQLARRQKKLGAATATPASPLASSPSAVAPDAAGLDGSLPMSERMRFVVFGQVEQAMQCAREQLPQELMFSLLLQAHDPAPMILTPPGQDAGNHANTLMLPDGSDGDSAFDFQSQQGARVHKGRWTETQSSPVCLDPPEPAMHPLQATLSAQPTSDPEQIELRVLRALREETPKTIRTAGRYDLLWLRDLRRRELGLRSEQTGAPRCSSVMANVVAGVRKLLTQLQDWSVGSRASAEQQQLVLGRLWLLLRLLPVLGVPASAELLELLQRLQDVLRRNFLQQAVAQPEQPVLAPELLRDVTLLESQLGICRALLLVGEGEPSLPQVQQLWAQQWTNLRWHLENWRLENALPVALPEDLEGVETGRPVPSSSVLVPSAAEAEGRQVIGRSVAETTAAGASLGVRRLWCVGSAGRPCAGCVFCGAHQPHQLPVSVLAAALATFHVLRSQQARLLPKAVFRSQELEEPEVRSPISSKKKSKKVAPPKLPMSLTRATERTESKLLRWLGQEAFTAAKASQLLELLAWSTNSQSQLARVLTLDLLLLFPDPMAAESQLLEQPLDLIAEQEDESVGSSAQVYFYRDLLELMVRLAETPAGMAHEPQLQRLLDSLRVLLPKFSRWNRSQMADQNSPAALVLNRLAPGLLLSTLRLRVTSIWPAVRACLLGMIAEAAETAAVTTKHRRQLALQRKQQQISDMDDDEGLSEPEEEEKDKEEEEEEERKQAEDKQAPYVGVWECFWQTLTLTMEQSRALTILPAAGAEASDSADELLMLEDDEEQSEESPNKQVTTEEAGDAQPVEEEKEKADKDEAASESDEDDDESPEEDAESDDQDATLPNRAFPSFPQLGFKFQQWRWLWNNTVDAHTFSDQLWECLATQDGEKVSTNAGRRQGKTNREKDEGPSVWVRLSHALHHNQMRCVIELVLHFLHFEYEIVRPSQFGTVVPTGDTHQQHKRHKKRGRRGDTGGMQDDDEDGEEDLRSSTAGLLGEQDCCCPNVAVYHGGWTDQALLANDRALSVMGLAHLPCQLRLPQLATHTHRYPHGHALARGSRTLVQRRCLLMLQALQRHFLRSPPSPPQYTQQRSPAAVLLSRQGVGAAAASAATEEDAHGPAFTAVSLLLPTLFRLLISSDEPLQQQALECLACWRPDFLMPFMDRFRRLASETHFRNEMTVFHLRPGYNQEAPIPEEYRASLARVLIRMLYARLVKRRTTRAKTTLKGRRAAIMAYLAGLHGPELLHLFEILLQPFTEQLSAAARLPRLVSAEQQELKNRQLREFHNLLGCFEQTTVPPGLQCYDPRLSLSLLVGLTEGDRVLAQRLADYREQLGFGGGGEGGVGGAARVEVIAKGKSLDKKASKKQQQTPPPLLQPQQQQLLSWSPVAALLTPQLSGLVNLDVLWENPYLSVVPGVAYKSQPSHEFAGRLRETLPHLSSVSLKVLAQMLPGLEGQALPVWASALDFETPVRVKLSFLHMQEHMVKQLRFVARDYFPTLLTLTLRLFYGATSFSLLADSLRKLSPEQQQQVADIQSLCGSSAHVEDDGEQASGTQELVDLLRRSPTHRELFWSLPLAEPELMRMLQSASADLASYKQLRQLSLRRLQALLGCQSQFSDVLRQKRNRLGASDEEDVGESLGPRYLSLLLYLLQSGQPELAASCTQLGCLHVPGVLSYRALLDLLLALTEDPAYLQLLMYAPAVGADAGAASTMQRLVHTGAAAAARGRLHQDAAAAADADMQDEATAETVPDSQWLLDELQPAQQKLLCDELFPSLFLAIEAPHLRTDGDGQGDRVALQVAERLLDVEVACKGDATLKRTLEACWRRHADTFVHQVSGRLHRLVAHEKKIAQNPAAFGVLSRHALAQETKFPGWELYLLAQAARYVNSTSVACVLLQSVLPLLSHKAMLAPHTTPFRTNMPARERLDDATSAALFKREAARQSLFQLIHSLMGLLDGAAESGLHTGVPGSQPQRIAQQALEALSRQLLLLRPAYAAKSRKMLADCLRRLSELRGFHQFVPVATLITDLNSLTWDGLDEIPDHNRRSAAYRRLLSLECLGSLRVSVSPGGNGQPEWVPALSTPEAPVASKRSNLKKKSKQQQQQQQQLPSPPPLEFWTEAMLAPLCYQMLGELHHPDLSARTQASSALRQTLQVLGVVDRMARQHWQKLHGGGGGGSGEQERHFFGPLIENVLHSGLKRMLHGGDTEETRREAVTCLAAMYRAFRARFRAEQSLLGDAKHPERDFFAGIVDIQRHRRLKTLVRLRRLCERQLRAALRGQEFLPSNTDLPDDDDEEEEEEEEEDEDDVGEEMEFDGPESKDTGGGNTQPDDDEFHGRPVPLFGSSLVSGVLLPLVLNFLQEIPAGASDGTQQALLDASARAIGALSAHLSWGAWKTSMSKLIKHLAKPGALGSSGGRQKWLVRAVCAALHEGFPIRALTRMREELSTQQQLAAVAAEQDDHHAEEDDDGEDEELKPKPQQIQLGLEALAPVRPMGDPQTELPEFVMAHLQDRVLPQLYSVLQTKRTGGSSLQRKGHQVELEDGGHVFLVAKGGSHGQSKRDGAKRAALEVCERLPVAMAVVKVLVKLPELQFRRQFPKLVLILVNYLKSKTQTLRDETRKILVTLAMYVGPEHWPLIFRQLRQNLTRGYQRYVAVYTIFTLLRTVHDRVLEHRQAFPLGRAEEGADRQEQHRTQVGGLFRDSGRHAEQAIFDADDGTAAAPGQETAATAAADGATAVSRELEDAGLQPEPEPEVLEMDQEFAGVSSSANELELLLGPRLHSGDTQILREGCLDPSLEELLPVLCLHLSPDVRVERKQLARSTASALLREAKRDCLPDSWFHLTATVGFRARVSQLLSPLVEHLSLNCHTLKDVQHVSEILRRVGQGIQQNWSLTAADLLDFLNHALRVSLFGSQIQIHRRRVYAASKDQGAGGGRGSAASDDQDWESGGMPDGDDDGSSNLRSLNKIRASKKTGKQRQQALQMAVAVEDQSPDDEEAEGERLVLSWPLEQYDPKKGRRRPGGPGVASNDAVDDGSGVEEEEELPQEDEDYLTDEELLDEEDQLGFEDELMSSDARVQLATQSGLTDAMAVAKAVRVNHRAHLYHSRLGRSKLETFTIQKIPSSKPRISRQVQANTLAEFILGMLHNWLRKGSSAVPPAQLALLLEPFWSLLSRNCVGLASSSPVPAATSSSVAAEREIAVDAADAESKNDGGDPNDTRRKPSKGKDVSKPGASLNADSGKEPPVASQRKMVSLSSTMTELALRCLPFLIRIHAMLSNASRSTVQLNMLAAHCFFLLQSGQESVQQAAFKTLAALLRYVPNFSLTPGRAKVLLSLAQQAVNSHNVRDQAVGFTLLRAVIQRRITLPQVYDLAVRLSETMIKAQQETLQKQCAGVFLSFLLDYPLGEKRVREHLERLVLSFDYPRPSGRLSLLRFLELLFSRLPTDLLQQHADLFFFPMARNLVNDSDRECRKMTSQVLGQFLQVLDSQSIRDRYLERLYSWLSPAAAAAAPTTAAVAGEEQQHQVPARLPPQQLALQDCAVQMLSVFIEACASSDQNFQQRQAPAIVRHLFRLLRGQLLRQRRLQLKAEVQADDNMTPMQQHLQLANVPGNQDTAGSETEEDEGDAQETSGEEDEDGDQKETAEDSDAEAMEVSDEDESESDEEGTTLSLEEAVGVGGGRAADPWSDGPEDAETDLEQTEGWKLHYHALIAVEKLAQHLPAALFTRIMCQRLNDESSSDSGQQQEPPSKGRKRRPPSADSAEPSSKKRKQLGGGAAAAHDFEDDFDTAWTGVCRLLLHPHSWIRMVSSRIVGTYFGQQVQLEDVDGSLQESLLQRGQEVLWQSTTPVRPQVTLDQLLLRDAEQVAQVGQAALLVGGKRNRSAIAEVEDDQKHDPRVEDAEDDGLWQQHAVFQLARSFCRQLAVDSLDARLADQIVKNLLFCLALMHRSSELCSLRTYSSRAKPAGQTLLQQKEAAAAGSGNSAKKRQKLADSSVAATASDEIMEILGAKQRHLTYHASPAGLWVITRLSFLARQQAGGLFRKDCIFRLFSAAATVLDSADLRAYLLPMLHVLYRVSDSPPINNTQEAADIKRLAQQTVDVLRKNSAGEDFVAAYTHVRQVVMEIRAERKKLRRQAVVVDPVRAASRRLAQSRRKRDRRKVQLQAHKHRRQFGVNARLPGSGDGSMVRRGVGTVLQR